MDTRFNQPVPPVEERHGPVRDAAVVQHALDEVLSSTFFRNTQQGQNLLRYIVKHSLAGEDHLLRERVIGSEVFGRRPDYEPGEDPVVRLRAAELRKRLAQYYQSVAEPPQIHFEIPAGSYKATFCRKEDSISLPRKVDTVPVAEHPAPEQHPVPLAPETLDLARRTPGVIAAPKRGGRRRVYIVLALVVIAISAALIWTPWDGPQNARFHAFWSPWTSSRNPVIIAIGSNAVYRLSDNLADQYARTHGLQTQGEEFFVPFGPDDTIRGSDLVPAETSFVALGDVAAVSHVVANITRQKQSFQERFPNDISFAELRNSPSLLIGGFNNAMTLELTRKLRFVLRARNEIDDTQDPTRHWLLNASRDSHDTEDYAIVTRLVRSNDAPMLSVAGMGQYGTLAAADFICSPAAISDMARNLPEHWESRNLQLVLHVKVVDFKVAATQVVAVHTW